MISELTKSELGFVLIQSDTSTDNVFDILADKASYKDRQGLYGNEMHIAYHLFPLMYQKNHNNSSYQIEARVAALKNVFSRWTLAGYNKHKAKDPFSCKAFIRYTNDLDWNCADYLLLLVDETK